jgi:hypothetical protein
VREVEEKRNQLRLYISVVRGLISYHERMVLPLTGASCGEQDNCPALVFENDLYLATLKEALVLLERELAESCR